MKVYVSGLETQRDSPRGDVTEDWQVWAFLPNLLLWKLMDGCWTLKAPWELFLKSLGLRFFTGHQSSCILKQEKTDTALCHLVD